MTTLTAGINTARRTCFNMGFSLLVTYRFGKSNALFCSLTFLSLRYQQINHFSNVFMTYYMQPMASYVLIEAAVAHRQRTSGLVVGDALEVDTEPPKLCISCPQLSKCNTNTT